MLSAYSLCSRESETAQQPEHMHMHEHLSSCQPGLLYAEVGELRQLRDLQRQRAKVLMCKRQSCQMFQGTQGSGKPSEACDVTIMP